MRPIDADMAIDAIQKDREISWKDLENDDAEYRNGCDDGYAYSMQIISELPSIQRKKGKWIVDDVATEHCSICKHSFYISALFAVGGNDEPPCCPNCGAKME